MKKKKRLCLILVLAVVLALLVFPRLESPAG